MRQPGFARPDSRGRLSPHEIRTDLWICQEWETCGGALVDCNEKRSVGRVFTGNSTTRASIFWEMKGDSELCGIADRDVVTARQQSWLQQPVLRIARSLTSEPEPWHWCGALRIQQAWEGEAAAASASGTKAPTIANKSRNLAVRRCMGLP